jgi:hypothetical protein
MFCAPADLAASLISSVQVVDEFKYYSVVTASAERAVPGCAAAVRNVLAATISSASTKAEIASKLGLCDPLPLYLLSGSVDLLVDEISMIVMYTCELMPQIFPASNELKFRRLTRLQLLL